MQGMDMDTPCMGASSETWQYLEGAAERLFYLGESFGDEQLEQHLIDRSDETYEAGEGSDWIDIIWKIGGMTSALIKLGGDIENWSEKSLNL